MSSSPVQTLEQERARASFDTAEMINILAGSAETAQIRELVMAEIENNELLSASSYDLSLPEIRSLVMEKIKYMMVTYARRSGFSYDSHGGAGSSANSDTGENAAEVTERMTMTKKLGQTFWDQLSQLDSSWAIRIGVHFGLFQNAVNGQGTEEQRAKYGPLMQKMRIFGCFAMTELGHGSYVRGLETTSTYYSATEEFVINTPTVTATKWWIGGAGQTATHAVVYARLIIEGKDYGVQGFIVQLRDLETGEPLPGIEVGDCGAKMGRNGVDNGWIRFHKVRVPRENMLMRWAQVSADGVFTQPPKAQMSYGALIPGRVMIMRSAAEAIKKALTIAIRYSAVRRQFPSADDPNVEEKILDYQTHKHNLMPMLATTYAMHMTAVVLTDNLDALKQDLENDDLTSLQEVHATSAGLKAFSTWWANSAIEVCRQALGGHGYSSYSGLPSLLADFAINCTWEGTNVVMAQQTSRFLMSACSNVRAGRLGDLSGFEGYLVGGETTLMTSCTAGSKEDLASEETLFDAHRWVAIKLVFAAHDRLEAAKMGGMNETAAWNECMVDLVACARAHCYFAVLKCFSDGIARLDANANASEVAVLRTLFRLFGVSNLEDYLSHTRGSYFSEEQAEWLSELKRDLCDEVRVNAVALVDSFALSDVLVNSPLGCYDGDIYSRYFEAVKAAPHAQGIPPYFEEHIKPLTSRL